jgi:hypothetical protein
MRLLLLVGYVPVPNGGISEYVDVARELLLQRGAAIQSVSWLKGVTFALYFEPRPLREESIRFEADLERKTVCVELDVPVPDQTIDDFELMLKLKDRWVECLEKTRVYLAEKGLPSDAWEQLQQALVLP